MTKFNTHIKAMPRTALFLAAMAIVTPASAGAPDNSVKLLSAKFDTRQVVQIEVGDFHFVPWQAAPVHTHVAPAIGYVVKGTIIYQVEGEREQILHEGDAFYEPVGPRILRFDNASATQEAIFIDLDLEQKDEPFIVFPKPPTEAIDRRSLPTLKVDGRRGKKMQQVDVYENELAPSGKLKLRNSVTTIVFVAEGVIDLQVNGKTPQRIIAGQSYNLPDNSMSQITNVSSEVPAKLVTFRMH